MYKIARNCFGIDIKTLAALQELRFACPWVSPIKLELCVRMCQVYSWEFVCTARDILMDSKTPTGIITAITGSDVQASEEFF